MRWVWAQSPMYQRSVSLSCHPHGRTRPATRSGVGEHARVCPGTAGKKKGGSPVRGTQESDRIASLAPAPTEVRTGAVLLGSGGAEHQATGALPQPTDNTCYRSCLLAEVRRKNSATAIRTTQKHSDHALFQHPRDVSPTRLMAPDTCCARAWSVPGMCTKGIRTLRDPRCGTTPSQRKRPVSWAE